MLRPKKLPLIGVKQAENVMEKAVENKKRVSPRFSKLSTVMVMLLLTLFCQVSQAAATKSENKSFSNQNINKTAAIFLDPLGDVEIIIASWNLVTYYNMDAYFHIKLKSNVQIQKMRMACGTLHSFEDQCKIVLDNMQNQLIELK